MPKTALESLRFALRGRGWLVAFIFFLILLGNVLSFSVPYFLKLITDYVTETPAISFEYQALMPIAIGLAAVYLLQEIGFRVAHYLEIVLNVKVFREITAFYFNNLINRPSSYFEDTFSGKLSRRIEQIGTSTKYFLESFLWEFGWSVPAMFMSAILLYIAHPLLGHSFLIWTAIFVVVSYPLLKQLYKRSKIVAEKDSILGGEFVDAIANVQITHSFARGTYEDKRLGRRLEDMSRTFMSEGRWFLANKIHQGLSVVSLGLLLVYVSIYLFGQDQISVGDFVLVASTIPLLTGVIWNMGDMALNSIRNYGNLHDAILDIQTETEKLEEGSYQLDRKTSAITFKNVSFNYKNSPFQFEDFTLEVTAGSKVGIVGSSGAGKSTLIKLLLRHYDVDRGEITVGDRDIKLVNLKSLRDTIAFVPQDTTLFHRTLFENIQYANPKASIDEVLEVCKKAHAHEFIQALPQQYETLVGERGIKLSGGQRQRIAIARAMLKDAPILVLDEATSALDGESEEIVQNGFKALFANRTVIAVAHRLSTLREMDRIVVMEEGKIIEDGHPTDLLQKGGAFKEMWDHQKGGFVS